jgi:hypothetical protein
MKFKAFALTFVMTFSCIDNILASNSISTHPLYYHHYPASVNFTRFQTINTINSIVNVFALLFLYFEYVKENISRKEIENYDQLVLIECHENTNPDNFWRSFRLWFEKRTIDWNRFYDTHCTSAEIANNLKALHKKQWNMGKIASLSCLCLLAV